MFQITFGLDFAVYRNQYEKKMNSEFMFADDLPTNAFDVYYLKTTKKANRRSILQEQ